MSEQQHITAIPIGSVPCADRVPTEFHVSAAIRRACGLDEALFQSTGNVVFANLAACQRFALAYNAQVDGRNHPERYLKVGQLNAMGLIDEIFHYVCRLYRLSRGRDYFDRAAAEIESAVGREGIDALLEAFVSEFPPLAVWKGTSSARDWLASTADDGTPNRAIAIEELSLLRLANENPALEAFSPIFSDSALATNPAYLEAWDALRSWSARNPPFGPEGRDLISMLKSPIEYSPFDLKGQLEYIRTRWGDLLGDWLARLLAGLDLIAEEEKPGWAGGIGGGSPDMDAYVYDDISKEYERFSPDRDWMPNVVLMAKSVLVWLSQLSRKYGRDIRRLDQIPDEELDELAKSGFTGLWLIGLWERSPASARIKQICGNPEAAASAYSLDGYDIAGELGGWEALERLRERAWRRGIRMASDMVPNHTGMDSRWVVEKPDLFLQTRECPFPGYDFRGENLSRDGRVGVYLENHYYTKSDCAVVFQRVDHQTGDVRYIYHGNDGTGMPWNDTAQIDFLNPAAREEVIQAILHVARNFPIIRFDAAMVLAKKHIQRLWYPEPGKGGDIPSRSQHALTREEFERRIPEEFWREVVDRCAREVPDTLLLAEAFWMMEGYFVRTLGMHRVYNSAFMNMLKREDNAKYRTTIKNTLEFDPEVLRRYVNFMNNPDEETAVAQFGKGDKYIGVCAMMVAMPGLPMFGHGQIEGFEEKYGMEYRRAYRDEVPDEELVERHRREIFPLMRRRRLFAGVEHFRLYDFWEGGAVNENVFAWSNRVGQERALILYNNVYGKAAGWVKDSAAYAVKGPDGSKTLARGNLAEGLGISVRDGRFCLLREERAGLWFVRTAAELHDDGLYAELDGFKMQVFLDIREVDDGPDGHYRALHTELAGRGVRDVGMAIQGIVHRSLYAAIESLFATGLHGSEGLLASARRVVVGDNADKEIAALRKAIAPAAEALVSELDAHIGAGFGAEDLARGRVILDRAAREILANRMLDRVSAAISAVARGFGEGILESTIAWGVLLVARDALGGARGARLIALWDLDRKLAEILERAGMSEGAALADLRLLRDTLDPGREPLRAGRGPVARFRSFLRRAFGLIPTSGPRDAETARVLRSAFSGDGAGAIGVHEWGGVLWFNKERAERAFLLIDAADLAEAGPLSRRALARFSARRAARRAVFAGQAEAAGYRVEDFLSRYPVI